jgi:DNA-binding NarL/FixJ family response regulator
LREVIGAPIPPVDRATYERAVATARAQFDAQLFVNAWAEGRTMSLEGASAAQIRTVSTGQVTPTPSAETSSVQGTTTPTRQAAPTSPKKTMSYPDELSAREVEVLRLLAQGWSDAQIAEQLVISPRTVNTHLTSIYRKIQVTSRSAATRYALDHRLV